MCPVLLAGVIADLARFPVNQIDRIPYQSVFHMIDCKMKCATLNG